MIIDKRYGTKVNFADKNNVLIGFDMAYLCCENFGWFITNKICEEIIKDLPVPDIMDFSFDINFFKQKDEYYYGNIAIFRLIDKNNNELFLHLYNAHNGYYSHGFEVIVNGKTIRDGKI